MNLYLDICFDCLDNYLECCKQAPRPGKINLNRGPGPGGGARKGVHYEYHMNIKNCKSGEGRCVLQLLNAYIYKALRGEACCDAMTLDCRPTLDWEISCSTVTLGMQPWPCTHQ